MNNINNEYLRELLSTLTHFIPPEEEILFKDTVNIIVKLKKNEIKVINNEKLNVANIKRGCYYVAK